MILWSVDDSQSARIEPLRYGRGVALVRRGSALSACTAVTEHPQMSSAAACCAGNPLTGTGRARRS